MIGTCSWTARLGASNNFSLPVIPAVFNSRMAGQAVDIELFEPPQD
jgi:hypothetical protein